MPMNETELLNAIIDDGVYEITTVYTKPYQTLKKEGGIAGFEACRHKRSDELMDLLISAKHKTQNARENDIDRYWYHVMFERQIEWVINVVSAAICNNGGTPLVSPTAKGYLKAMDILGVKAPV